MRGNLPKREPAMQEKWAEMNIYEKVQEHTKGRPLFVLHDGLHMRMVTFIWDMH